MSNIVDRIKAPTPKFHLNIAKVFGTVAAVTGALEIAIASGKVVLPEPWPTVILITALVSGSIAGTATTAKKEVDE